MTISNYYTGESLNNINGQPIHYNPDTGFPVYFYRQKARPENYIYPAAMVQFNTIRASQDVTVRCTAWAKNFNDGEPYKSEEYSVDITFNIHK